MQLPPPLLGYLGGESQGGQVMQWPGLLIVNYHSQYLCSILVAPVHQSLPTSVQPYSQLLHCPDDSFGEDVPNWFANLTNLRPNLVTYRSFQPDQRNPFTSNPAVTSAVMIDGLLSSYDHLRAPQKPGAHQAQTTFSLGKQQCLMSHLTEENNTIAALRNSPTPPTRAPPSSLQFVLQ
jgi:hypothetical protein